MALRLEENRLSEPPETADDRPAQRPSLTSEAVTSPLEASQLSDDEIAREAFERFQRRGAEHGGDVDDWLEAERELRERRRQGSR